MARLPQLRLVAKKFGLKLVSIKDLIAYRVKKESLVRRVAVTKLPTAYGEEFTAILYANDIDRQSHVALVKGDIKPGDEVQLGDTRLQLPQASGAETKPAKAAPPPPPGRNCIR